jgi:hypothetical protein
LSRKRSDRLEIYEYLKIFKEVTINISPRQIWNPEEIMYGLDPSRIRVLGEVVMLCIELPVDRVEGT